MVGITNTLQLQGSVNSESQKIKLPSIKELTKVIANRPQPSLSKEEEHFIPTKNPTSSTTATTVPKNIPRHPPTAVYQSTTLLLPQAYSHQQQTTPLQHSSSVSSVSTTGDSSTRHNSVSLQILPTVDSFGTNSSYVTPVPQPLQVASQIGTPAPPPPPPPPALQAAHFGIQQHNQQHYQYYQQYDHSHQDLQGYTTQYASPITVFQVPLNNTDRYHTQNQQHSQHHTQQPSYNQQRLTPKKKRPRRKANEMERLYACNYKSCKNAYGTLNHLNAHITLKRHGPKRKPEEFKQIRELYKLRKKSLKSLNDESVNPEEKLHLIASLSENLLDNGVEASILIKEGKPKDLKDAEEKLRTLTRIPVIHQQRGYNGYGRYSYGVGDDSVSFKAK